MARGIEISTWAMNHFYWFGQMCDTRCWQPYHTDQYGYMWWEHSNGVGSSVTYPSWTDNTYRTDTIYIGDPYVEADWDKMKEALAESASRLAKENLNNRKELDVNKIYKAKKDLRKVTVTKVVECELGKFLGMDGGMFIRNVPVAYGNKEDIVVYPKPVNLFIEGSAITETLETPVEVWCDYTSEEDDVV